MGGEDTSVKHIRPGSSTSGCVVGISNARGQRVVEQMVARDAGKTPRWNRLLRHSG